MSKRKSRQKKRQEKAIWNAARWDAYRAAALKLNVRLVEGFVKIDQLVAERLGKPIPIAKGDRLALVYELLGPEWDRVEAARERRARKALRRAEKNVGSISVAGVDVRSNEFLETYEWRRLRMSVLKKRGARCECCGASPRTDENCRINVDHIKPRRLFPELALVEENLQVLCNVCNHGKGNWDQTDWRDDAASEQPVVAAPPKAIM